MGIKNETRSLSPCCFEQMHFEFDVKVRISDPSVAMELVKKTNEFREGDKDYHLSLNMDRTLYNKIRVEPKSNAYFLLYIYFNFAFIHVLVENICAKKKYLLKIRAVVTSID